jgi:hypothetical protein
MRVLLIVALALVTVACGASERRAPAGADVWGKFETGVYGDIGDIPALRVAPPDGGLPNAEVERIIRTSLDRRGYAVAEDAPLTLRYIIYSTLTDSGDGGLGVAVGGSAGSSSGVNEIGIGLDLGLLSGNSSVRQVSFLFELALEGADGALLWRGRAAGRTRISGDQRIARPVAPLLIDRLGRETASRRFAR